MRVVFMLITSVFALSLSYSQPINDSCNGAIELNLSSLFPCPFATTSSNLFVYNNEGATPVSPYPSFFDCGAEPTAIAAEVWFTFTPDGEKVNIQLEGLQTPNIALFQGDNCNNLISFYCASSEPDSGYLETSLLLESGQKYYMMVAGATPDDQGAFTLVIKNQRDCNGCQYGDSFTAIPPPVNGTYQAGDTVHFCYTINQWDNSGIVEWPHSLEVMLGDGWDKSSFVPTPPPSCDGNGIWGWYNEWTSCNSGQTFGPGFAYESSIGVSCGGTPMDDNPGNNWGDGSGSCAAIGTNAPALEFCWTVVVDECFGLDTQTDLSILVDIHSDGESGSWIQVGCNSMADFNFLGSATCIDTLPPFVEITPASCPGTCDGSLSFAGSGTGPWDYSLYDNSDTSLVIGLENASDTIDVSDLCGDSYTMNIIDNESGYMQAIIIQIEELASPIAEASNTGPACPAEPIKLQASSSNTSSNISYSWTGPDNFESAEQNPLIVPIAGAYILEVTIDGCTSEPDTTFVEIAPLPEISLLPNDTVGACTGDTVALAASGALNYTWSNANNVVLSNEASFNYRVEVEETLTIVGTNEFGCSDTAELVLSLLPAPDLVISQDTTICPDGSATLTVSGAQSYLWNNGETASSIAVTPFEDTFYEVTATDENGCTATAGVTVFVSADLVIDAGPDQSHCLGDAFAFIALASGGVPPYQFSWDDPDNTGGAFLFVTPDTSTTYTISITDALGCTTTDEVTAFIYEPTFTLSAQPSLICSGQKSTLTVENGTVVEWSTGSSSQSIDVTPNETSTYSVTVVSSNNCLFTSDITVEVYPVPELPAIQCISEAETLTFEWPVTPDSFNIVVHSGQNGEMITNGIVFSDLSPEESVHITMEIFDENGCVYGVESSCSTPACPDLQLEIQAIEDICLYPGLPSISLNGTVSGGNGNGNFIWDGPGVSQSGTFNPFEAGPGTHTIVLNYFEANCSISESIDVNVETPLNPPVIACSSTDIAVEFSWDPVPGAIGYNIQVITGQEGLLIGNVYTVIDLQPSELVTIEVTAVGTGICGSSAAEASCIALSCDDLALELPTDISVCFADAPFSIPATVINGLGNGTYLWSGDCVIDPVIGLIDPQACGVGTHNLFVTYTEGNCTVTGETTFSVLAPSSAQFAATPTICLGNMATVIFTGPITSNLNYEWDFDGGTANTGIGPGPHIVSWDTPGEKTISLSVGANGCTAGPFQQTVLVQETLSPPDIICEPGPGSVTFSNVPDPAVDPVSYAVSINSMPILPPIVEDNQIVLEGLLPGDTVALSLSVFDPGPCDNVSAIFSCIVEDCPDVTIALEQPDELCLEEGLQPFVIASEVLGVNLDGIFTWSGTGIIDPSSGLFDPFQAGSGVHQVTLSYEDGPCSYATSVDISIVEPARISNINVNCNEEGSHYFLTFDVESGSDVYTITSDSVASGELLDERFEVVESCRPIHFELTKSCDCTNDAGLMAQELICGIGSVSAQFLGGAEFNVTDLLRFYLHDNSGNVLGNVIAKRNFPAFNFNPNVMEYGQIYYVSAVVGPNNGIGQIDLDDPCTSVSIGQPVVFSQKPSLNGPDEYTVCAGQEVNFGINLPVSATVHWTPEASLSCADCPVPIAAPSVTTTYLGEVTDDFGCMTAFEVTVFVDEFPSETFPEEPVVACPGKPFEFCLPQASAYSWTGPNGFTINNRCLFFPTYSPGMAGTYTGEVTLDDGCVLSESIEIITDDPLEINYITPDTAVCQLDFFTLTADVEGADHYIWFPASNVSCQTCPTTTAFINSNTVFTLVALAESGCQITRQITVTRLENCNGLDIFLTQGLTADKSGTDLFPNPVNDELTIRSSTALKWIEIYTLEGKLVERKQTNEQQEILNVSRLPEGTYFARIQTNQGNETQKFVIMR